MQASVIDIQLTIDFQNTIDTQATQVDPLIDTELYCSYS